MYELRRTYVTLPGRERLVASILVRMGQLLHEIGHRSPSNVSFNGGTCPGERRRVYMTWTDQQLESTQRAGNYRPPEYYRLKEERDRYTTDTWLEVSELMNDDKLIGG